jgi:hypothetical protein
LSTAPAVFAPEVLASRDDGVELPTVVPVALFSVAVPLPVVLLLLPPVVVWPAAGPPVVEPPPAVPPVCANAVAPESAKAAASVMVDSFMHASFKCGLWKDKSTTPVAFRSRGTKKFFVRETHAMPKVYFES